MQVISRQLIHRSVAANSDQVIAFLPMPPGSKINNIWFEAAIIASASQGVKDTAFYGMSGAVVHIDDPDTPEAWDDAWDGQVGKDKGVGYGSAIGELDTVGSDSNPEFEIGLIDIDSLMGLDLTGEVEFLRRRKMVSFPGNPLGFNGTSTYWPCDHVKMHIRGGTKVDRPSGAMIALSSPEMGETTAAAQQTPSAETWLILQFIDMYLEDMFKHLVGSTGGVSEDPYEDAETAISNLLENQMFEPDVDALRASIWTVSMKTTWDYTIDGFSNKSVITSE